MPLITGGQTIPPVTVPTHQLPPGQVPSSYTSPATRNVFQVTGPTTNAGLVLSPAAEPFPHRLVEKVRSRQFVEMRELLSDNISLIHQLEAIQGYTPCHTLGPARPRLREVSSLPTWCYCFLGYIAMLTTDPATRDQLAYARLIIREALRHGGPGWLDYDRAFRQQAATDPSLRWNTLLPGLLASTVIGQGTGQAISFCTLCREVDHTRAQCALTYLQPPPRGATTSVNSANRRKLPNICMSWNKGACIFPGNCSYRHVCSTCQLQHRARDCPNTPDILPARQRSQGVHHSAMIPPP